MPLGSRIQEAPVALCRHSHTPLQKLHMSSHAWLVVCAVESQHMNQNSPQLVPSPCKCISLPGCRSPLLRAVR